MSSTLEIATPGLWNHREWVFRRASLGVQGLAPSVALRWAVPMALRKTPNLVSPGFCKGQVCS